MKPNARVQAGTTAPQPDPERERRYFDIACERISRAQAQGALLPPEEPRQPVQAGLL